MKVWAVFLGDADDYDDYEMMHSIWSTKELAEKAVVRLSPTHIAKVRELEVDALKKEVRRASNNWIVFMSRDGMKSDAKVFDFATFDSDVETKLIESGDGSFSWSGISSSEAKAIKAAQEARSAFLLSLA